MLINKDKLEVKINMLIYRNIKKKYKNRNYTKSNIRYFYNTWNRIARVYAFKHCGFTFLRINIGNLLNESWYRLRGYEQNTSIKTTTKIKKKKKKKEHIIQNQKSPTNYLPDLLIGDCATRVTPMSVIWLERRTKTRVHKKIHHAKKKKKTKIS